MTPHTAANTLFLLQHKYYIEKEKSLAELASSMQKQKLQKKIKILRRYIMLLRKVRQKRQLQERLLEISKQPKPMPICSSNNKLKKVDIIPKVSYFTNNNTN